MVLNNKSILDKVRFLLSIAKKGTYDDEELNLVLELTEEHTDNIVLGRVFGYSVSDYAIAVLSWLNTEETKIKFRKIYNLLPKSRQNDIDALINYKPYLEY